MSDDSESEDSDYVPEEDKEELQESIGTSAIKAISTSRKRKANALYEEMVLDDKLYCEKVMSKSVKYILPHINFGRKVKRVAAIKKLMLSIFGSAKSNKNVLKNENKFDINDVNIREAAKESVERIQKKHKVLETRKFAGQAITIERSVSSQEETTTALPTTQDKSTSLDKVLTELKGPKTVSTIAKSSYDWENFKEKEGLEDELAVAKKDGYLKRKEFLERCDVREYEKERDSRPKAPSAAP